MPTGVCTKRQLREDTGSFHPQKKKKFFVECVVLNYFQKQNSQYSIRAQSTRSSQKRIVAFLVDRFCSHCNTVFELLGGCWHFCPCQEMKNLSINEMEEIVKRKECKCQRKFLLEIRFKVCVIWECDWWKKVKNNVDGAGDYMPFRAHSCWHIFHHIRTRNRFQKTS